MSLGRASEQGRKHPSACSSSAAGLEFRCCQSGLLDCPRVSQLPNKPALILHWWLAFWFCFQADALSNHSNHQLLLTYLFKRWTAFPFALRVLPKRLSHPSRVPRQQCFRLVSVSYGNGSLEGPGPIAVSAVNYNRPESAETTGKGNMVL